jgi:Right handed beta helix region
MICALHLLVGRVLITRKSAPAMSTKTGLALILLATIYALHAEPTQAQSYQVFVAARGSDSNPCTIAAPCLTFQHAHDTVRAWGEVYVLDPADYGELQITKAINIQGHGFARSPNVTIRAAAADEINLYGLVIAEPAGFGIRFASGSSLVVANCVIRNQSTGLHFQADATSAPQTLFVSNSYFTDNGWEGIVITKKKLGRRHRRHRAGRVLRPAGRSQCG